MTFFAVGYAFVVTSGLQMDEEEAYRRQENSLDSVSHTNDNKAPHYPLVSDE